MSDKDLYLYDKCPTCDVLLNELDPDSYQCPKCGTIWNIDELVFKPIQKNLGKWL